MFTRLTKISFPFNKGNIKAWIFDEKFRQGGLIEAGSRDKNKWGEGKILIRKLNSVERGPAKRLAERFSLPLPLSVPPPRGLINLESS